MKVLMIASEAAPLAKTGGLADVLGALPPELARRGCDVRLALPLYASVDRAKFDVRLASAAPLGVPIGPGEQWCAVHEARLPGSAVPVYLFEHHRYFSRPTLYQFNGRDYDDNAERFAFLPRAALQWCKALDWVPDVVHAHDWQAALAPMFLKTHYREDPHLAGTASVMSLHNLGYQGNFRKEDLAHGQFGWEHFTPGGLEFHGGINYLKAGILFADKVATVSPTYAWEIATPEGGWGLDPALRTRLGDLVGILNGLDYREWNPAADAALPARFDAADLAGKAVCKAALQQQFGLPVRPEVPIVGVVTRLAYQKGIDVLAAAAPRLAELDLQLVVLGDGEVWANFFYGDLPRRYPGKIGVHVGYDDRKAHLVYAGSDLFLMPSRYEPCGLGQLSAKRYGAVPVVRATGGLRDTVAQYDEATGAGDGFRFEDLTPEALANTVGWAVSTWYDRPEHFARLRQRGMADRFDWANAAARYADLYRWAVERKRR